MAEEAASASETSVTEVVQTLTEPNTEMVQTLESNKATVESGLHGGGNDSTCNNGAESAAADEKEREKTLEFADELTEQGSGFLKEKDYAEAVDCFSRSLEIRVSHFGELDVECVNAYYQYGLALLEKAQAEADPFGDMSKKEDEVQQESSTKDGSVNNTMNGESVTASVVSSNPERQGSSSGQEVSGGKDQGEGDEDCQDDDLSDADEDDSDLDTAWKMLDIARAISDKQSTETMEKVEILCALAEISLEREDIESSLSDYKKALSILERLVEPDSRRMAELNFRICICLETGCQSKEAIPYCQKAISICKARMERLSNEIKGPSGSATSSTISEGDESIQLSSSNVPDIDTSGSKKEAEIEDLAGLAEDLEKKLEDLKQQAENPKQVLAELMGLASSARDKVAPPTGEISSSRMGIANTGKDLESPTVSTAHTGAARGGGGGGASSGVTHLGVVGRGVKRVNQSSSESIPSKKIAPESLDKVDGK